MLLIHIYREFTLVLIVYAQPCLKWLRGLLVLMYKNVKELEKSVMRLLDP